MPLARKRNGARKLNGGAPQPRGRTRAQVQAMTADAFANHTHAQAKKERVPDTRFRPRDIVTAKKQAIEGMRMYGVLVEACRASGIGRRAMYELFKEDPQFKQDMRDARNDLIDGVERDVMLRAGMPRGTLDSIFFLKHNRVRYREIQRVQLSGSEGGPIQYLDVKAELLRRLTKLAPKENVPLVVNGVEVGSVGSAGSRGPGARGLPAGSAGSAGSGSEGSRGPGSRGPTLVPDDAPRVRKADVPVEDSRPARRKRRDSST